MPVKTKSNEITIFRIYDAPLKAVWDAWSDPEQIAQWWGPRGFTITTHDRDMRTGGHWKYTMHGPDGVEYANTTQYLEVADQSKLVYDHGGNDEKKPLFRVTAHFTEKNGKTHLDMSMALPTPEAAEQTRRFIKQANGETTWDRLAEYLAKKLSGKEIFSLSRTFDAPIDLLFDMWTNSKHFSNWIAPTGFTSEFLRADIKPGGSSFYCMSGGENMKMYGRAEYSEVQKPNRIVYTQQFCDENEKVVRHPMAATWPETKLTVVELTEESPTETRVTLTWQCHGKTTPEELETFVNARAGMTQGWTGSFDKLESYLQEIQ